MRRTTLAGLNGSNPLGFLGSLGLLRVLRAHEPAPRLGFLADGSFRPFVESECDDLPRLVAADAASTGRQAGWWLEYGKQEKRGAKTVADLKAPPEEFARFLARCVERWCDGDGESVAYAAAFGTSEAVDGKGNTKPTAFHFTAAHQQFLGGVEQIRAAVTAEWAAQSLFEGHAERPGSNLRWDPAAERNWALMAGDPTEEGTRVDAPVEWLAFRALPLFPTVPVGKRVLTTAVSGRGDAMRLTWPLWDLPASLGSIRSVLQVSWDPATGNRRTLGIFAVCTSAIRRTAQGFGNFAPASVAT